MTPQQIRQNAKRLEAAGAPSSDIEEYVKKAVSQVQPVSNVPAPYPYMKSLALGAGMGASLDWGDEGAGLIAGAGKDIMAGKFPTVDSYRNARDSIRNEIKRAKSNPKVFLGGELGGGGATMLIPGMQGNTLARLALMGGAQGLGNSEADLTREGNLGQAAMDTVVGGATGAVLGAVPPLLNAGMKAPAWLGKKFMSTVLGPSKEAIEAYLEKPGVIKSASMENLAGEMPQVATKFNNIIKDLSGKAKAKLSTSNFIESTPNDPGGAFTKDEVFNAVANARKKLGGVYTDESRTASNALNRIEDNLKKLKNTASQNQVHDLITDLDSEIPWDSVIRAPETLSATDKALIDLRSGLDKALKTKNPDYADAMAPVGDAISSRNEFVRKFGIKRIKGEGFQASDTTYPRVNTALKEGKLETDRVIGNVKRITGMDIAPQVQDAKYGQEFIGGKTNGSRNVNSMAVLGGATGAGIGSAFGFPVVGAGIGSAGGAAAGSYIDKNGGEIAANLLDRYLGVKQGADAIASKLPAIVQQTPEVLGKYAPLLKRAAQLGGQQVLLQHGLLMDTDPEYQKVIDGIQQ